MEKLEIEERLHTYASLTEQGLQSYLPAMQGDLQVIFEAARYSALGGGKRLRPALLMEFFALCGGRAEQALPFAAALEMIHTYSLIHDDLPCMDDDDLRRGRPTNHKVYGEAMALLAGDALLTRAFETMLGHVPAAIRADHALKAASILAACAGMEGMIGGQVMDLAFERRQPDSAGLTKMVALKTGMLLKAACMGGCALAGEHGAIMRAADTYAQKVGLAFQIQDDILDVVGDEQTFGKPIGSDAQNHKTTFVTAYGLEECRRMVDGLTDEAVAAVQPLAGSDFLCSLAHYLAKRDH